MPIDESNGQPVEDETQSAVNESTASDQDEGSSEAVVDETTTNIDDKGP